MTQIKKTASFAVLHFMTVFAVAWAMTGSMLAGGVVALVEPASIPACSSCTRRSGRGARSPPGRGWLAKGGRLPRLRHHG